MMFEPVDSFHCRNAMSRRPKTLRLIRYALSLTTAVTLLSSLQAQTRPEFEVADVHTSAPKQDGRRGKAMFGGDVVRGGRYEIRDATMVDLIHTAYNVDRNAVIGGPTWLAMDRFDIIAKPPDDRTTMTSIRPMLQTLLQDRFKLSVRNENKPMPAWVLSKGEGTPNLKTPIRSAESGCRIADNQRVMCRNITLDGFAATLRQGSFTTLPVVNATGIEGLLDFDLNYTISTGTVDVFENSPIVSAVARQLGLRIEIQQVPQFVITVDSVNRTPMPNAADIQSRLPPDPIQFEVASIRSCETADYEPALLSPSGLVSTGCRSLNLFVILALDQCHQKQSAPNSVDSACPGLLLLPGAADWMTSRFFSIQAKSPIAVGRFGDPRIRAMLRQLLIDRFKLSTHYESREVSVRILEADKPKLARGDTAARSECNRSGSSPYAPVVLTCRNVTMAQFAEQLEMTDFSARRILDGTNLPGTWDFKLTYGGAQTGQRGVNPGPSPLSVTDAVEQQLGLKLRDAKRSLPVVVIDHIDERPTEN